MWEVRLQIFVVQRFRKIVDELDAKLISLENGQGRTPETIALLLRMGLEDGLPDLMLLSRPRRVRFLEVKLTDTLHHRRTDLSDAQVACHNMLHWFGFGVPDVIRSWHELLAIIDEEKIPHRPPPAEWDREQGLLWSVETKRRRPRRAQTSPP